MKLLEECLAACKQKPRTILFPDAEDVRIIEAARYLKDERLAEPVLIGSPVRVREFAAEQHRSTRGIKVQKPEHDSQFEHRVRRFFDKQKQNGMQRYEARDYLKQPNAYAADALQAGKGDLCLTGNTSAVSEVLQAALRLLEKEEHIQTVSSFALLSDADEKTVFAFADTVVIPRPKASQLAEIAVNTAKNFERISRETARVAMLSFSTNGSADHALTEAVKEAVAQIHSEQPGLCVDGEIQFDAAVTPKVATQKMPESKLAGQANVFIFPSLNAANIGFKIAQHLAGYAAYGPFIQGLQKPVGLLSAQSTTQEIINTALLASCLV